MQNKSIEMDKIRTNYRILLSEDEIRYLYKSKVDINNLPPTMELMPNGIHVASYLTDEEFHAQEGRLFPVCPITGAFGLWDEDYNTLGELF